MTPTHHLNVVGFAGSLRDASFNRLLLRAAVGLAPDGMTIGVHDIAAIPLYNRDDEEAGVPQPVLDFKTAIAEADGLLVVTPEYNFGLPAVTKNALDWASLRSGPGNVLADKPVAIMGMAGGVNGTTAMARSAVRQTLTFPGAIPMPRGDVGLSGGAANFDETGALTNESARVRVLTALEAFADWIRFLASAKS